MNFFINLDYNDDDYIKIAKDNRKIITKFLTENNDSFEIGKNYCFGDFKDKIKFKKYNSKNINLVAIFKKIDANCYLIHLTEGLCD